MASSGAAPALIIVLLPGTSLRDWQTAHAPILHRLMQTGSLAVMNTRTAHTPGERGRGTPQSALLTLGAGARAAGPESAVGFLPASDQVNQLFERRTGIKPHPNQSVCLDWPAVLQANRSPGYDLRLGSLTDTLAAHGITVAAGGGPNADWVAAGNNGTVQRLSQLQAAPRLCLIWDAGPSLASADSMLQTAAAQATEQNGRLIVLSPYADDSNFQQNERLTPILVWGANIPAGLLFSPSTRRPGLVTNTDFAPAVADYFGIKRTEFRPLPFGFAWSAQSAPNNVRFAEQLNSQAVQQAQGMKLLPYLAVILGCWTLAITLLSFRRPIADFWTLIPMAALTAALFAVSDVSFGIILLALLTLAWLLIRFLGINRLLAFWTSAVVLALTADMLTGNQLMHRGLLGYSAIEGARYYGIGNEAMGLLLGSALTASARLWSAFKASRLILISVMAVIVLLLGSAGAKAGGVLVSLTIFGTFCYAVTGRRWTGQAIAVLGIIIVFGMAIAALGDAFLHVRGHSHIGEAVQRIGAGGPSEARDIVRRKLAVEGRLAYHSAWAVLLWSGMLCTGLLWKRMPPMRPTESALRLAGIVGLIACLLLNDAGVVAAAIFMVSLWSDAVGQSKASLPRRNPGQGGQRNNSL